MGSLSQSLTNLPKIWLLFVAENISPYSPMARFQIEHQGVSALSFSFEADPSQRGKQSPSMVV